MSASRALARSSRAVSRFSRPFSAYAPRFQDLSKLNSRGNDTREEYRKHELERPLNPHLTNTTTAVPSEGMPSVGAHAPPPELISAVGKGSPRDAVPEHTDRMTGGTQPGGGAAHTGPEAGELGVGEMEGASFKIEPLRRVGEDTSTTRARLLYQSRKRGTLESELLLSTFADANLGKMTPAQLHQYDLFLDENDWDIYYWATQEPTPTSAETAEGSGPELATANAQGKDVVARAPASGEWAQTVGTFKPAYRPVPQRWRDSEILSMLRRHVEEKSAGEGKTGKGMGFMPTIKNFDN